MAETKARKSRAKPKAKVVTTKGAVDTSVVVPAGGIDPRLVEERERRREAEKDVKFATPQPAYLDPKLAEVREATRKREKELAGRTTLQPRAR